jgi:hypothetical protein
MNRRITHSAILVLLALLAPACDNRESDQTQGSLFGDLVSGWGFGSKPAAGAPPLQITRPTSAAETSTTAELVELAGWAADDVGVAIVTWSNATTGMSGIAEGTTSWTATVPLDPGENLVEVSVTDVQGRTATDAILIARR